MYFYINMHLFCVCLENDKWDRKQMILSWKEKKKRNAEFISFISVYLREVCREGNKNFNDFESLRVNLVLCHFLLWCILGC